MTRCWIWLRTALILPCAPARRRCPIPRTALPCSSTSTIGSTRHLNTSPRACNQKRQRNLRRMPGWAGVKQQAARGALCCGTTRGGAVSCCWSLLSSDFSGVHRLLIAGGGIGAIPEIDAAEDVAAGRLVPVLPHWHVGRASLHALSVQGRNAPARVRVFRDFARDYLQRLCGEAGAVTLP